MAMATMSKTNNLLISFCAISSLGYSSLATAATNQFESSPAGAAAAASGYFSQSLGKQLPLENVQKTPSSQQNKIDRPSDQPNKSEIFVLKSVSFSGFKKVPYSELLPIVSSFENKEVSINDIRKMSDELVQYFAQKGFVVQVFAPPQEVVNGELRLLITQANLGGVSFAEADNEAPLNKSLSGRMSAENSAANTIYSSVGQGSVIDLTNVDRALVILNEQQANKIYRAELKQGFAEGQTDLSIVNEQQPTVVAAVDVNNYGVKSTGRTQGGAQIAVRDLLGLNESFSIGGIFSEGLTFGKFGYVMPIGVNGLKISADVSALSYITVGDATPAKGSSVSESLQISYPILASINGITKVYASAANRKFQNYTYDELVSSYSLKSLTVGIGGNSMYGFLVPNSDTYNFSLLQGSSYNSSSPANYQSIYVSNVYQSYVPNNYTKFNASYSKNIFFTDNTTFLLNFSGQLASNNLNSAENFYVGGPDGVRAYLPGTVYGSQGGMINSELNYRIFDSASIGAFYDFARVQQYKFQNSQIINQNTSPNVYSISGAGLKASYNFQNTLLANIYVARATDVQNLPSLNANGGSPNWVFGFQAKGVF